MVNKRNLHLKDFSITLWERPKRSTRWSGSATVNWSPEVTPKKTDQGLGIKNLKYSLTLHHLQACDRLWTMTLRL